MLIRMSPLRAARLIAAFTALAALAASPAAAVVIPKPPAESAPTGKGKAKARPAAPAAAPAAVAPAPPPPNPLMVRQRGHAPRPQDEAADASPFVSGQSWSVVAVGADGRCEGSLVVDMAQPDAASGILRLACRDRTTRAFTQAAALVDTGDSIVMQLQPAQGGTSAWRTLRLVKDGPMRMTGTAGQGVDAYAFTLLLNGG